MKPFRLDRRAVLRGVGSVAIALPWLEAMAPLKASRAAAMDAKRFVAVYWPGGTVIEDFRPIGSETDFKLSPILAPLQALKDKLVVFQGLDLKCANGDQHQSGMVGWLTGCNQVPSGPGKAAPSLDQAMAAWLGTPLLYQAVRWASGHTGAGAPHAANIVSYQVDGYKFVPVAPEIDPAATWQRLFGSVAPAADQTWRKSILDSVLGRYAKLSARLGTRDRQRLEAHMEKLRELEKGVAANCQKPVLVDTTGYNPVAYDALDPVTDAAMPKVGKLMMDMMVAALSCELASAATLQWADSGAGYTLPWLGLDKVQNCYENNCGYQRAEMTKIFTWYSTQHAYLLEEMRKVDMGGHTLLDESVVFFGTQLRDPPTHLKDDMPFLLAGGGGGLVGNRYRDYGGRSHNDLLVSIANLFGDNRTSFGDPAFNTGPLGNLTTV